MQRTLSRCISKRPERPQKQRMCISQAMGSQQRVVQMMVQRQHGSQ